MTVLRDYIKGNTHDMQVMARSIENLAKRIDESQKSPPVSVINTPVRSTAHGGMHHQESMMIEEPRGEDEAFEPSSIEDKQLKTLIRMLSVKDKKAVVDQESEFVDYLLSDVLPSENSSYVSRMVLARKVYIATTIDAGETIAKRMFEHDPIKAASRKFAKTLMNSTMISPMYHPTESARAAHSSTSQYSNGTNYCFKCWKVIPGEAGHAFGKCPYKTALPKPSHIPAPAAWRNPYATTPFVMEEWLKINNMSQAGQSSTINYQGGDPSQAK
jgi:hypothetical protein